MSIVIGFKHDNHVLMACDAISSTTVKFFTDTNFSHKISIVHKNPMILVGSVGLTLNSVLLKGSFDLFKDYDKNNFKKHLVDNVYSDLLTYQSNYNATDDTVFPQLINGSRLIAVEDQLFVCEEVNGGEILEINSFSAIGSGSELAIGSLLGTENTNFTPKQRIIKALQASSQFDQGVGPPYYIFNTKNSSFIKYDVEKTYDVITYAMKEGD